MEALTADLRYAIRLLAKSPRFALAVIVVLALGIGANSAMFTVLDRAVIRPLPYADADRLVMLWEDFSAFGTARNRVSPATFLDWRKRTQSLVSIAAYAGGRNMDLAGQGAPEQVSGLSVTANLIPLLGVPPLLGRTFTPDEEGPETKAVVLSYRLWQRRFGGDPKLVGGVVRMNGEPYSVIGVMPAGFQYPDRETELWLPLGLSPRILSARNSHFLKVVARLRPDRGLRQAQADMSAVARQMATEFPVTNAKIGIAVIPLKDEFLGDTRTTFLILLAAAGCVLLIACANVGNLLLARAAGRRVEIAVRAALGASPRRLIRQILTENLLLAGAGGLAGLAVARWSMAILEKMIPPALGVLNLRPDSRVLAFTMAVSILTGLLFGLAPALELSRPGAAARPNAGSRRVRDALVVAEIAIALVLAVGAALLIQTLGQLRAVDPGFRPAGILTADLSVPIVKYSDSARRHRFYQDVLARIRAIPGVKSAGLTSDLPYTSRGNTMSLAIEGRPAQNGLGQDALFRLVSAGYLETIGARLGEGRFPDADDAEDRSAAVVINETLARMYFPGDSAIGKRIDTGTGDGTRKWMTIVGVVKDIRERGIDWGSKPAVYVPFPQTTIAFFLPSEVAVLAAREPSTLAKELQQAVWSVDPEQPVSSIRTMDAIVDGELANRAQVLRLLGAFAALAVALAALGIHGVLSYVVAGRTREIGLRMAIGASRGAIVSSILGYAARLAAAGLGIGIVAAMACTRLLSTFLFGVSPLEPKAFAVVAALLASVALLASYLPVRRAASVDPAIPLRQD
jgi:predicted permease